MQDLYYVVEKHLQQIDLEEGVEETTGWKTITVYDIDTQTISLIEVCQFEVKTEANSEEEIFVHLKNECEDENEYNLIQL